ncbi:MAG: GNAT family N-acetyltransferase [Pseudomonadota bacterium]
MIVRPLAPVDGPAWHRLLIDGTKTFPSAFLQSAKEARSIPADRIQAIMASGDFHGVFAPDNVLIGFAALRQPSLTRLRHRATIGPFYIAPTHHGRGAADRLMAGLCDAARAAGIAWLDLWVAASNGRAIAFYTRHDFEQVARRPDAVRRDGLSEDDLLMTRHLEAPAAGG